jgi:tetratricopeptide (TPR) repeat protein
MARLQTCRRASCNFSNVRSIVDAQRDWGFVRPPADGTFAALRSNGRTAFTWFAFSLLVALGCSASKPQTTDNAATLSADAMKKLRAEAEISYSSGEYAEAEEQFTQLIAAAPENKQHYLWRSQTRQRQGKLAEAATDLNAAVRLAPKEQEPILQRSRLAYAQGQVDQALADVGSAIALGGPLTAGAHVMRSGMYLERKDYQACLRDCDAAIAIDPELLTAYNNRGLARQALGNEELAIADFSLAIERHRQYADPYNNRGALYMQLGRTREALADLDEAIRLEPLSPAGYDNRSRLQLEQLHDAAAAEKDCTRLIQVVDREAKQRGDRARGGKTAAIYARRARARSELKQHHKALADCQAALAIDGNCKPAKELLAQLLTEPLNQANSASPPLSPHGAIAPLKTED